LRVAPRQVDVFLVELMPPAAVVALLLDLPAALAAAAPDLAAPRAALRELVAIYARARLERGETTVAEVSAVLRELADQLARTGRRARAGRGGIRGRRHGKTSQAELAAEWFLARDFDLSTTKAAVSREIAAMKGETAKYVDERLHRGLRRLSALADSPELAARPHLRALLVAEANPLWREYRERNRAGGTAETLELIKAAWKTPNTPEALPADHPAWSRIRFPDWLTARDYAVILREVAAAIAPRNRAGRRRV
jgi:hypothetical protein